MLVINMLVGVYQDSTILKKFSDSPPYFDFSSIEEKFKKIQAKERIKSFLDARLRQQGTLYGWFFLYLLSLQTYGFKYTR